MTCPSREYMVSADRLWFAAELVAFPIIVAARAGLWWPKESIMNRPKLPRVARERIVSGKARPLHIDKDRLLPLDLDRKTAGRPR